MKNNGRYFVICVNTRVPETSVIRHVYGYFQMSVKISCNDFKIIYVDHTCITEGCKELIKDMFLGYNIDNGTEEIIGEINKKVYCPNKDAVIAAIKEIYKTFKRVKNNVSNSDKNI